MAEHSDESGPKGFTVTDRRTVRADGEAGEPAAAPAPAPERPARGEGEKVLPHLDFTTFLMSLASSVLMHLGELQAPDEPSPQRNLPLAKQTIDIIGMLEEKTRGNLSDEEARILQHLLYDLRLKFVEARKK